MEHRHSKRTINIVGGFLGAGKTTFVNHVLEKHRKERVDVLVREYGAVAIDDQLIHLDKDNIHVFPGISVHEDAQLVLYDYLHDLYEETLDDPFDRLIIETSGLDTPESLVQLFFLGHMRDYYRLGSYIAVVDAGYGMLNLDEYKVTSKQIAYADAVILNKTDTAQEQQLLELEQRIRKINGMARIYRAEYGRTDLSSMLDIELYAQLNDLEQTGTEKEMDSIQTIVLSENRPMDKGKINQWIARLFEDSGRKILRGKGFFSFQNDEYRYEFQSVRKTFHSKADRKWTPDEERRSTVVLIGENLSEDDILKQEFSACAAEQQLTD